MRTDVAKCATEQAVPRHRKRDPRKRHEAAIQCAQRRNHKHDRYECCARGPEKGLRGLRSPPQITSSTLLISDCFTDCFSPSWPDNRGGRGNHVDRAAIEAGKPMQIDPIHRIYSMSTQITSVAGMTLDFDGLRLLAFLVRRGAARSCDQGDNPTRRTRLTYRGSARRLSKTGSTFRKTSRKGRSSYAFSIQAKA